MSSIDRRVVEARFDNQQFERGVKDTRKSLENLKKDLDMKGAADGFRKVDAASRKLSFGQLADNVSTIASRFSVLQLVGVGALTAIGAKAVTIGGQLISSLSFDQVTAGFQEYELKLGSIQTIMAGSGASLQEVNGYLEELNTYADRTIYSFADMTQNIGKFTNAGVDLDVAVKSIQGIANVAAVSGANSNEASRAMYNFAQALSKGYVQLIDWKSIELANMGTVEFKQQLIDAAEAQGLLTKRGEEWVTEAGNTVTATKGFNDSLTDAWLTTEVLNKALGDYADETTEIGKKAFAAAQDVKTFTQLLDTVKEAIGSGWARTFELFIGDFDEAKALFTDINNVISSFVDGSSDARNQLLSEWKELGGRDVLIEAFAQMFSAVGNVLGKVGKAFREVFPRKTAEDLYNLTVSIKEFFERIQNGTQQIEGFKETIKGIFAIFGIGFEIVKAVGNFLLDVFSRVSPSADSVLSVTGGIGERLVEIYEALRDGDGLVEFFNNLADGIEAGVSAIRNFITEVATFTGLDRISLDDVKEVAAYLVSAVGSISEGMQVVMAFLGPVGEGVANALRTVRDFFFDLPAKLADFFSTVDWEFVLSAVNTGLLGALVGIFGGIMSRIGRGGGLKDIADAIEDAFEGVTSVLSTMQNTLRATTLLQIAIALGIMSAALVALSRVDSGDLNRALAAMAAALVELFAAFAALQFIGGPAGLFRSAAGLVVLATAIRIMVESVEALAELSWDELSRGLTGLAGLLTGVVAVSAGLQGQASGLIRSGIALTILSVGIRILADAVKVLSDLSWEEMGRGLAALGAILVGLAIFTRLASVNGAGVSQGAGLALMAGAIYILAHAMEKFGGLDWQEIGKGLTVIGAILAGFALFTRVVDPSGIVRTGMSLLVVSGAMLVMAYALEKFGDLSWDQIGRGLTAMAGALVLVGVALAAIPASAIFSAGALVIASVGLMAIGKVLETFGDMSWQEIGKSLVALAGALVVIAAGLHALNGTIPGSIALIVAAGALAVLAPVLYALGSLTWEEIGKGLVVMAGAFVLLAAAGVLLSPTISTFLSLGASMLLFGAGIALLGVGLNLIVDALVALAGVGVDVGVVLTEMIGAVGSSIPGLAEAMAQGIVIFVQTLATLSDELLEAFTTMLVALLDSIQETTPKIIETGVTIALALLQAFEDLIPEMIDTVWTLMDEIFNTLEERAPDVVDSIITLGLRLVRVLTDRVSDFGEVATDFIVEILNAIADNITDVVTAGADIVIALVDGIGDNALRITEAAAETLLEFIEGLTDAINRYAPELQEAGQELAFAIADGMSGGLISKVGDLAEDARGMARSVIDSAKGFLGINSPSKAFKEIGINIQQGLGEGIKKDDSSIESMREAMRKLVSAAEFDGEMNPRITPIIDMSEIERGARDISNLFGSQRLEVGNNFATASSLTSVGERVDIPTSSDVPVTSGVTFIQNNNSPKALSTAEIYRQTKNQISQAKESL